MLFLQVTAEAITFAVNRGDDFRRIRSRFEMLIECDGWSVNGTVVRLKLTAGHFQQFST